MRNIYKAAAGLLVAGVLIAGVGSGVAFAEYSTFEYGGNKILEGSKYVTKTVSYQVNIKGTEEGASPDGQKDKGNVVYYLDSTQHYNARYFNIVEDASVAKDCIEADIKYLTDRDDIQPEFISEHYNGEEYPEGIYLSLDYGYDYGQDYMRIMMRAKDMVLEDLKKKQIGDYRYDGIEEVIIRIHPEAEFKLESMF